MVMATPATARRGDQGDLASTPRPSISPLSVASKPNRSPKATRMAIPALALAPDVEAETTAATDPADTGELDDDRSSSLSEPGDDDLEEPDEAMGSMGRTMGSATAAAHDSLDVDSEAETDRLGSTPQKTRPQADANGKTPSKLSHAAAAEDELSEPPSPLPMDTGAASSTTTIATAGTAALHAADASLADEGTTGKKRKRSESADSPLTSAESDLEESPRKRSHEMPAEEVAVTEEEPARGGGAAEEAVQDAPAAPPKLVKGKKGRPRGRKAKEVMTESEAEGAEEHAAAETELGAEAAAKTEQRKPEVSASFEAIAKRFAAYRELVLNERIAALNYELEMLQQPDCQHPDYLRQVACVDARRDKQVREAQAYYRYRFASVRQRTLGDRAQLQSQYHQSVRDMREETMSALGEDWCNIQRERRDQHQDKTDAHIYRFPAQRSEQIKRQAQYNQEVSVLSGVAKYVGFPAAPELEGIKGQALESDMKAMKVRVGRQKQRSGFANLVIRSRNEWHSLHRPRNRSTSVFPPCPPPTSGWRTTNSSNRTPGRSRRDPSTTAGRPISPTRLTGSINPARKATREISPATSAGRSTAPAAPSRRRWPSERIIPRAPPLYPSPATARSLPPATLPRRQRPNAHSACNVPGRRKRRL